MNIQYDKSTDSVYITLKKGAYSHSKKVTDGLMVDVTKTGQVMGIEILAAKNAISHFDPIKLNPFIKSAKISAA